MPLQNLCTIFQAHENIWCCIKALAAETKGTSITWKQYSATNYNPVCYTKSISAQHFYRLGLFPRSYEVVPALVAHPKGRLVEADSLDSITVTVIPLCCRAMLHAVVPVADILKEVDLHIIAESDARYMFHIVNTLRKIGQRQIYMLFEANLPEFLQLESF